MKMFVLHPGEIISKNDGDTHFIDSRHLIACYGLHTRGEEILTYDPLKNYPTDAIHLYPLHEGNYLEVIDKELSIRPKGE
jgi:hypothetical protein